VHTTPTVPTADLSDNALIVEMMTADNVVGEDASPTAAPRQTAALAAAVRAVPVRQVLGAALTGRRGDDGQ
jgi:hypothetical protein